MDHAERETAERHAEAGEDVEADFGPSVDSLRDFDGFVFGVVRRLDAIDRGFRSVHREVGV